MFSISIKNCFILFFFLLYLPLCFAETLYLKNGELINGKIKNIDDENITIESELGYGILSIPRNNIQMISFPGSKIDLNHRFGIGYLQRKSTTNTSKNSFDYIADQISFKTFLSSDSFLDILFGYGTSSYKGNEASILSVDGRYGYIFDRSHNIQKYYGVSAGIIQVKDESNSVDEKGTTITAFLGFEIFFPSIPNFGFAGELAIGRTDTTNLEQLELSTSTFPSFSIHYYF